MNSSSKIILGIDPGTVIMGYAVIVINGNDAQVLHMDVLKLLSRKDAYERLEIIFSKVCDLIKIYQPTMFAIEAPFFGKNVQSMLKLGRAQGVAIAAAMQASLPVTEYSPKRGKNRLKDGRILLMLILTNWSDNIEIFNSQCSIINHQWKPDKCILNIAY